MPELSPEAQLLDRFAKEAAVLTNVDVGTCEGAVVLRPGQSAGIDPSKPTGAFIGIVMVPEWDEAAKTWIGDPAVIVGGMHNHVMAAIEVTLRRLVNEMAKVARNATTPDEEKIVDALDQQLKPKENPDETAP